MPLDPSEIYYGVDGARQGPVDIETLRARLQNGSVSDDDYVWDDALDEWVPIRSYAALYTEDAVEEGDPGLTAIEGAGAVAFDFATPLLRLTAWIVDVILLLVPVTIWELTVESILGVSLEDLPVLDPMATPDPRTLEFLIWFHAGAIVLRAVYWAGMESSRLQATLGKKMLGMVVVDETGHRAPLRQTAIRFLGRLFCELTFGLGYLLILFDARRQGLHDRLARTFVVRT